MPTFHLVCVSQTLDLKDEFTTGWAVVRTEEETAPEFASRLYLTQAEAAAEAQRLASQHA
jgi:hypothetical protein